MPSHTVAERKKNKPRNTGHGPKAPVVTVKKGKKAKKKSKR